jgi:hypothetical protein
MKTLAPLMALLIILGLPQVIRAEAVPAATAAKAIQISDAHKANAALMREYSWHSRTEIVDQGRVKDLRLELINYGPGGQQQRTLLNDQGAQLPRGFIRRALAENERQKLEEYLTGLRTLLEQYELPTPGKVLDFINQATTTGPDAGGLVEMTARSVVAPGDTRSEWTDAHTQQTRKIQVTTTYQGDLVNLTATFKTLASGLTHVAFAEITVPAKQIGVQVQNFDYNRNN